MKKPMYRRAKSGDGKRRAGKKDARIAEPAAIPKRIAASVEVDGDGDGDEAARSLPEFMIAGIGASAGGLEACTQLLEALPSELGLALIIVQHLAPKHDSFLPELLAAHSKMPVVQVTEGVRVAANQIYVIPPNAHMHIADGKLHLVA